MFIPEEEAERRISSPENLVNGFSGSATPDSKAPEILPPSVPDFDLAQILELSEQPRYAGRGTKGLHRDVQAGIGITASYLGTTAAARTGDVALSSAYSYERGYTGPVDAVNPAKSPKEELQNKIIEGHGIIVDLAFKRLLSTLNILDDDKLKTVKKAGELAGIAKNLSGVIAHASQATKETTFDGREQSVHFHIMRPEQATDKDYRTIEISSEREETAYQDRARER